MLLLFKIKDNLKLKVTSNYKISLDDANKNTNQDGCQKWYKKSKTMFLLVKILS